MGGGENYSIGEISKIIKITPDTLRHYDAIRLMRPGFVNPETRYRYYTEEQVVELMRIVELKSCGLSLGEIKAVIKAGADDNTVKSILNKKRAKQKNGAKAIVAYRECCPDLTTMDSVMKWLSVYKQTADYDERSEPLLSQNEIDDMIKQVTS